MAMVDSFVEFVAVAATAVATAVAAAVVEERAPVSMYKPDQDRNFPLLPSPLDHNPLRRGIGS